jgi:glycosyltransferase involved in cell wall biosynthesis
MDFIEAARLNTDPEIEFYLMGSGENEAEILDYIRKHDIRINWLGYRPRGETLDVFTTMQVGVSPATNDVARQVASPLKILDYAACGLPVVTVAVGEWSEIFRDYDAGVVCAECGAETLLAAIRSLKNRDRWTRASQNAQRLIHEARTWPAVLAPLYDHLRSPEILAAKNGMTGVHVAKRRRKNMASSSVSAAPHDAIPLKNPARR